MLLGLASLALAIGCTSPESYELREGLEVGIFRLVEVQGRSLDSISVRFECSTGRPVRVTFDPGTLFTPTTDGTSAMVILSHEVVLNYRNCLPGAVLRAAAVGMNGMRTPNRNDQFTLAPYNASEEVTRLVALEAILQASSRVQQYAVWTVTQNPTSQYRYTRIGQGSIGAPVTVTSGPSDGELLQVRALLENAGFDPENYFVLRRISHSP